jgi:hypothetical protein
MGRLSTRLPVFQAWVTTIPAVLVKPDMNPTGQGRPPSHPIPFPTGRVGDRWEASMIRRTRSANPPPPPAPPAAPPPPATPTPTAEAPAFPRSPVSFSPAANLHNRATPGLADTGSGTVPSPARSRFCGGTGGNRTSTRCDNSADA